VKYINKQSEPSELLEFKRRHGNEPVGLWDKINHEPHSHVKEVLHESLMSEQGYICCYCEKRVTGKDSHIEHFKPRRISSEEEKANYDNLLASCGKNSAEHCGHVKDNDKSHDSSLFVSPLEPDCEVRFRYTEFGDILPRSLDDRPASETINRLRLNHPSLRGNRKSAFLGIMRGIKQLSQHEIQQLIDFYENRDPDNRFQPFCTAVLYHLRQNLSTD
jgi:uncharacterized protein (TIGR02646 family)